MGKIQHFLTHNNLRKQQDYMIGEGGDLMEVKHFQMQLISDKDT